MEKHSNPTRSGQSIGICLAQKNAGFTLIEVIVGLVILGVVVGVVALSLGRNTGVERLRAATQRAQALISTHCRQNAILQGQVIGVLVGSDRYQFVSLFDDTWLPIPSAQAEVLHSGTEVWVSLDGRRAEAREHIGEQPQIFCLPTGELTPFSLHFELIDPPLRHSLQGASNGHLEIADEAIEVRA